MNLLALAMVMQNDEEEVVVQEHFPASAVNVVVRPMAPKLGRRVGDVSPQYINNEDQDIIEEIIIVLVTHAMVEVLPYELSQVLDLRKNLDIFSAAVEDMVENLDQEIYLETMNVLENLLFHQKTWVLILAAAAERLVAVVATVVEECWLMAALAEEICAEEPCG